MSETKNSSAAPSPAVADDLIKQRADKLIADWARQKLTYEGNRDARELDITVEEARAEGIVAGNEIYIGRRIIDANIARETPTFIQFISSSARHITLTDPLGNLPPDKLSVAEDAFTRAFRIDNWEEVHRQAIDSMELHGRGVFFALPAPLSALSTKLAYLPIEDFIFPTELRSLQTANMLAVSYKITGDQLTEWTKTIGFLPDEVKAIVDKITVSELVTRMFELQQLFFRVAGIVYTAWYSYDTKRILKSATPYTSGACDREGNPQPATQYPFFPIYSRVTETPQIIERKGHAHEDRHDQEGLTALWTNYTNASTRASELYITSTQPDLSGNPEVTQTDFIIEHGKCVKSPVNFISPPWPDASGLSTMQALRTENSSQAGQVDYAALNKRGSRTTATELDMAKDQADQSKSLPLTTFSMFYGMALQYQYEIWAGNIKSGYLKADPITMEVVASGCIATPAGSIDYVERNAKLKRLQGALEMFGTSPLLIAEIQKEIIQLAFPKEAARWAPLLQDQRTQIGQELIRLVEGIKTMVPPEQQAQVDQILQQATAAFTPPK